MAEINIPIYIVFTATPWGETILKIYYSKEEADKYIANSNPLFSPYLYVRQEHITTNTP